MGRQADGAQQEGAQRLRVVRLVDRRLGQGQRAFVGAKQQDRAVAFDYCADDSLALGCSGDRVAEGARFYIGSTGVAQAIGAGVLEGLDRADEIAWSPASTISCIAQSNQAAAPSSTGAPCGPLRQPTAAKRSSEGRAKVFDTASWSSARMLTAKPFAPISVAKFDERFARQTSRSAGSRETEVKELAVKPIGRPSTSFAVTTVTPVRKEPKALRSARGSM